MTVIIIIIIPSSHSYHDSAVMNVDFLKCCEFVDLVQDQLWQYDITS
jgi:hypothetical protein